MFMHRISRKIFRFLYTSLLSGFRPQPVSGDRSETCEVFWTLFSVCWGL